jgi:hypothetical protein
MDLQSPVDIVHRQESTFTSVRKSATTSISPSPFLGTQVVDYPFFRRSYRRFYVAAALPGWQWLVPQLMADGAKLGLVQSGNIKLSSDDRETWLKADVPNM